MDSKSCAKSALCGSRRELHTNACLLAKFGFDTAENEPCQVCPLPRFHAALVPARRGEPEAGRPAAGGLPRRERALRLDAAAGRFPHLLLVRSWEGMNF